jgi:hypothetical protein
MMVRTWMSQGVVVVCAFGGGKSGSEVHATLLDYVMFRYISRRRIGYQN